MESLPSIRQHKNDPISLIKSLLKVIRPTILNGNIPVSIYLLKVNKETLEKGVKNAQS